MGPVSGSQKAHEALQGGSHSLGCLGDAGASKGRLGQEEWGSRPALPPGSEAWSQPLLPSNCDSDPPDPGGPMATDLWDRLLWSRVSDTHLRLTCEVWGQQGDHRPPGPVTGATLLPGLALVLRATEGAPLPRGRQAVRMPRPRAGTMRGT